MATITTTALYDFDPLMTNTKNLVPNERQTLQTPGRDDYYFIIPKAAPFFAASMVVVNDQTGVEYKEGVDYVLGHYFVEAMNSIDKQICGSIRFLKRNISGIARMTYHTLGGQWGFNDAAILAELANKRLNPLTRSWEQIDVMPASFPVVEHDQNISTIVGSEELEDAIRDIADTLEASASGTTESHLKDFNNPHRTTAAQVGLGNVPNWAVATDAAARAATAPTGFMTPYLVGLAISALALAPLNEHIANRSNPHGTTAEQLGLGSVANYPPATREEAMDPTVNNRYLTPYGAALLLTSQNSDAQYTNLERLLNEHIQDRSNVHQVTAHQTGTYTSEEIDQLLKNATATDTPRFDGMTSDEWRATLPSFDDLSLLVTNLGLGFSNATIEANKIIATDPRTPADLANLANLLKVNGKAHYNAYGVWGNDYVAKITKEASVAGLPLSLPPGTDRFCTLENAAYWIDANGAINSAGSAAIAAPAGYAPGTGFLAANAMSGIFATKTAVYAVNDAGKLIRYVAGGAAPTVLSSAAFGVWCNTEAYNAGECVIIQGRDNSMTAAGSTGWRTAFAAVVSSLGGARVTQACIGDDKLLLLLSSGELRIWDIARNNGNLTLTRNAANQANPPTGVAGISGRYRHYAWFTGAGVVTTLGDNSQGQCDIPASAQPVAAVLCGNDYSVTIGKDGQVQFWGDSPTNGLLYKAA